MSRLTVIAHTSGARHDSEYCRMAAGVATLVHLLAKRSDNRVDSVGQPTRALSLGGEGGHRQLVADSSAFGRKYHVGLMWFVSIRL